MVEVKCDHSGLWTDCLANIASNNICVAVKFILEDLLGKLA